MRRGGCPLYKSSQSAVLTLYRSPHPTNSAPDPAHTAASASQCVYIYAHFIKWFISKVCEVASSLVTGHASRALSVGVYFICFTTHGSRGVDYFVFVRVCVYGRATACSITSSASGESFMFLPCVCFFACVTDIPRPTSVSFIKFLEVYLSDGWPRVVRV